MPTTNATCHPLNHPFAHAAFRSLTYEEASRLSSVQAIAIERPS